MFNIFCRFGLLPFLICSIRKLEFLFHSKRGLNKRPEHLGTKGKDHCQRKGRLEPGYMKERKDQESKQFGRKKLLRVLSFHSMQTLTLLVFLSYFLLTFKFKKSVGQNVIQVLLNTNLCISDKEAKVQKGINNFLNVSELISISISKNPAFLIHGQVFFI